MSNLKAVYMFLIYIYMLVATFLIGLLNVNLLGKIMSNVVLNILKLLFETLDFWGDTTT